MDTDTGSETENNPPQRYLTEFTRSWYFLRNGRYYRGRCHGIKYTLPASLSLYGSRFAGGLCWRDGSGNARTSGNHNFQLAACRSFTLIFSKPCHFRNQYPLFLSRGFPTVLNWIARSSDYYVLAPVLADLDISRLRKDWRSRSEKQLRHRESFKSPRSLSL